MNQLESLPQYSVIMSVYEKDQCSWLTKAIESMVTQSYPPSEIVIVIDGPISAQLSETLKASETRYAPLIRLIPVAQNQGLAEAMNVALANCRYDWVARMDADDISERQRCEKELLAAMLNQSDIVGCDCVEFSTVPAQPIAKRIFPEGHDSLVAFSRRKTPFCHPAVMMKKSAVAKAGGYKEVHLLEDYDLFVRMFQSGARGYTVKEILYDVRVSTDFYSRRGGIKYVSTLLGYNYRLWRTGWSSLSDFIVRSCGNIIVGLAPSSIRAWIYRSFLRK